MRIMMENQNFNVNIKNRKITKGKNNNIQSL